MVKGDLSYSKIQILSEAAKREGNIALPLPPNLRGGAAKKVVSGLIAAGFLAEVPAGRKPGTLVWNETEDGRFTTLIATAAGLEAIGIEPEPAGAAVPDAPPADEPAAADAPEGDGGATKGRAGSKQARLIEMLRAPEGASIGEIAAETGWQSHTIRGAIAGALKKKLGLNVASSRVEGRGRVYAIVEDAA